MRRRTNSRPSASTDARPARSWRVGPEDAGRRLDAALARLAGELDEPLSRSRLQKLVAAGHVRVDGRVATDPSLKVPLGAELDLDVPPPVEAAPRPEGMALKVLFEDADLLVIDKPAGLVVHPAAGHDEGTLVNALLAHCGASLSGIGGVRRPGIVHRLDKDTSGLMVVAKSDRAHRGLAATFADHGRSGSLERAYLAVVWGVPTQRSGTIDKPLGRHPHQREKIAVQPAGRGRHAVTHWRIEERLGAVAALLSCRLETGRTHQIRVHLADAAHPLLGDPLYGAGFRTKATRLGPEAREALQVLGRQALHAAVLGFDHPANGRTLRFESPLPDDLARLVATLRSGEEGSVR